jgi:hypothetical protein
VGPFQRAKGGFTHIFVAVDKSVSLIYGLDAMLPNEVEHKSLQVQQYFVVQSNYSRVDDLTNLDELREDAVIQSMKH